MKTSITYFLLLLFYASSVYGQSNIGKDFWFGFLQNSSNPTLTIQINALSDVSGIVEVPLSGWSQSFNLSANTGTSIYIPSAIAQALSSDMIENKAIHIEADADISVSIINYINYSTDGASILSTKYLGNEYIAMTYTVNDKVAELLIIGVYDNTEIEIIPSATTLGGKSANVPYTIKLNKGQTYQIQSYSDLTGTNIRSINKNSCNEFAVFSGNMCSYIPTGCQACDIIFDQLIPLKYWGKEYILSPLKPRLGDTYRFLSSEDNTNIIIDGQVITQLDNGAFYELNNYIGTHHVTSNNPILITQFSQGFQCDSTVGDPFMMHLIPLENMNKQAILFNTFSSIRLVDHYVNIITKSSDVNQILYDNINIADSFNVIPENPEYVFASFYINEGTHSLSSDSGYIAYSYGFGSIDDPAESYGTSLGFGITPAITITSPKDICNNQSVEIAISSNIPLYQTIWDFGDESLLLNTLGSNNATHIFKDSGVYVISTTSSIGCFIQDSSVTTISINNCENKIFIPNTFSPNGDGINDVLEINGENIKSIHFSLYDRWYRKIYETNDIFFTWIGENNKEKQTNTGIYLFNCQVEFINGDTRSISGNITIIK